VPLDYLALGLEWKPGYTIVVPGEWKAVERPASHLQRRQDCEGLPMAEPEATFSSRPEHVSNLAEGVHLEARLGRGLRAIGTWFRGLILTGDGELALQVRERFKGS